VELHKIKESSYLKYLPNDREKTWESFFSVDPKGKALLSCLSNLNKGEDWSTPTRAAKQIASLYRTSCLPYHSTHAESEAIKAPGMNQASHQLHFITCVANTFNLKLVKALPYDE
jgi:hypothetical protein